MKKIAFAISLLLSLVKAKAEEEDFCWSEFVEPSVPCCKSNDAPIFEITMEGYWGVEDGQKCGIKNKGYNWNLRDKFKETKKEWEAFKIKWDEEYSKNFERLSITPGEDETKLNFGWLSAMDTKPVIRLYTDEDKTEYKDFVGTNGKYIHLKKIDTTLYYNRVTVENLENNKKYYYQRKLNDQWEDAVEFNTHDPNNFKFIFVGDPQIGGSNDRYGYHTVERLGYSQSIRNDAFNWNVTIESSFKVTENPSILLSAGDQADTQCYDEGSIIDQEKEYSAFLLPEKLKTIATAPTLGNHEIYSEGFRYHFNTPNNFVAKNMAP